ncbi:hypothetical protein WT88_29400 [Burkholderia stagnalis]|uniref:hypothetical protein n=1 Tax=Burkholderia stagnalis TaxID=1503054 RepID=UPI0007559CD1|nr:hypothetical protein [Burkholderia stagnalis]KVZ18601.1 hypothetical protein WT35_04340 [Burkholderia stagnalis]KWN32824.1 hypothetical protein WT86_18465 [Burkholderia stagnalis]KWN44651.1 hypothetical protein WT88_29400 [Burkholderia stagnalis]KWN54384.1 hypothetical protein WT87_03495 [Burkholderia stagnalis]KWO68791.1 hypothetical protein WT99_20865 [Burkholderia stagnalis]
MTNAVTEEELLSTMVEGYSYRRSDVAALICDKPSGAVLDVLDTLVNKGAVWRTYAGSRFEYVRLSAQDLADMRQRRADRIDVPTWMRGVLNGYAATLAQHRAVCEASRSLFRA